MSWDDRASLAHRWEESRQTLGQLYPSRRRVGTTYQGFVKMLRRWSPRLLTKLELHWRALTQSLAGTCWTIEGWLVFGVDGTKIDLCRTPALERSFRTTGKPGGGPQALVTCLLHLGSGVMWGYRLGPVDASERGQLLHLLPLLPAGSLLVADAGFVGYGMLQRLDASGRCFLIRAGANVKLLRNLGWVIQTHGDDVYLWPDARRRAGQRPLALRLIRIQGVQGRWMSLLTNVLDEARLSDRQAGLFYRLRWGLETTYRTLKQTLGRRKMLSRAPALAALELRWTLAGLWLLQLLSVRALVASGVDPLRKSLAAARRCVCWMLRQVDRRWRAGDGLLARLRRAVQDDYVRRGPKAVRPWARKKTHRPPGEPQILDATPLQVQQAQTFAPLAAAA
jgi:hypothetical protein